MLQRQAGLLLGGGLAPALRERLRPHALRVVPGIGQRDGTGTFAERQIVDVEDASNLRRARGRGPYHHVGPPHFGAAVQAEPVGLHPARVDEVARLRRRSGHLHLLLLIPVAAPLHVGLNGNASGGRELGLEGDDAACGVAVQDRARPAEHFHSSQRPEIDVRRLRRAIGHRHRHAVLEDLHAAHAEAWQRRANREADSARQAEVAAVLHVEARNAGKRLSGRGAALERLNHIALDHRDRIGHRRPVLLGARDGHGDGFGERRDVESEIEGACLTSGDRDQRLAAAESGQHRLETIVTGRQRPDFVSALGIGDRISERADWLRHERHADPGKRSPTGVPYRASECPLQGLRVQLEPGEQRARPRRATPTARECTSTDVCRPSCVDVTTSPMKSAGVNGNAAGVAKDFRRCALRFKTEDIKPAAPGFFGEVLVEAPRAVGGVRHTSCRRRSWDAAPSGCRTTLLTPPHDFESPHVCADAQGEVVS